jgi:hypothetical protein
MSLGNWRLRLLTAAALTLALGGASASRAQEPAPPDTTPPARADQQRPVVSEDRITPDKTASEKAAPDGAPAVSMTQKANGQRRSDLPLEAYAVTPGTKFMVKLEEDLNTSNTPEKKRFKVETLEPLEAGSGIYLPAGAQISGHVSRIESAGIAGRARLYLTFDEIHTRFGTLPIVADIAGVPGDKSVQVRPDHEGVIEGRTTTQQAAGQAAAEGAAMGALHGVKDKNAKEASEGALAGALAAYLMESGRGHELELLKGAKLELELERALYLLKD